MNINRNTHPETCDPLLMEQYLADALDAAQEAAFQNHLETCSACRRLIQWAAACLACKPISSINSKLFYIFLYLYIIPSLCNLK